MSAPALRPLRWYRRRGAATRAHVALRWATAPFGPLDDAVPRSGRILEWGCGHGVGCLYLASSAEAREVVGVDIDEAKLADARAAADAAGLAARVRFDRVEGDALPTGSWDAVLIDDVLYLLDADHQRRLVEAAAAAVAPGGVLVIKDMGRTPRWKDLLTRAQERLAVRVAAITATADGLHRSPTPTEVVAWIRHGGLEPSVVRLDRGYHVPHIAYLASRPPSRTTPTADGRLPS